ncbi:hypothetical protein EGW08_015757 [Elysia chlorotica]|uniref:Major facilitator superfamily associated domain-containing protein n=1 Tax=Elysia chlorotica TaxID=188477 RepID=A0A433T4G4_ELYCH|nr:hypothetical protein EGW08_015757 [Elysia chlorotica]
MLKKCCKGDGHSRQPGFLQLSVLCAAFFANEITVTFELIYMVSVERLLSLPLQFVSLPGVVASASSFVIVPLMGRYTDSGNRHRRRSAMVVLSGALQFTGALLLLTACAKFIHIQTQSLEVNSKQNHGLLSEASKMEKEVNEFSFSKVFGGNVNETSTQFESDVPFNWTIPPNRNNDEDIEGESHSISSALTACLALVSFSVMAVGFDIGTSSIRAFVLDCVPPEAHSNVLSVGF